MQWLLGFVSGLLAGIIANWVTTLYFAYKQFKRSVGWQRIEGVKEATRIFKAARMGPAQADSGAVSRRRDEFRYSLGVMVQYLIDTFGNPVQDFNEVGPWPIVTDFNPDDPAYKGDNRFKYLAEGKDSEDPKNWKDYDRWGFFNRYVRPVIEDINPSTLVLNVHLPFKRREVEPLRALLDLCLAVESVTAKVDAAAENPTLLKIVPEDRKWLMRPIDVQDGKVKEVSEAMKNLHSKWKEWVRVVG
ncbi:MAG: hypothetical protein ABR964_05440 [Tepidisphaeraceae bacterium]|jgi:hypothetical protein